MFFTEEKIAQETNIIKYLLDLSFLARKDVLGIDWRYEKIDEELNQMLEKLQDQEILNCHKILCCENFSSQKEINIIEYSLFASFCDISSKIISTNNNLPKEECYQIYLKLVKFYWLNDEYNDYIVCSIKPYLTYNEWRLKLITESKVYKDILKSLKKAPIARK